MDLEEYGGLEVTETDDSIEPGKYTMQYVDETQMENDSGWVGLRMSFQIQGPKNEGRVVSGLFTVANANSSKSVEIGKTELSALASACGLTALKNTEELRGIKFNGMVKTNDRGYSEIDSNFGKNFSKAEQTTATPVVKAEKPKAETLDDEIPF